jgi:hypothetical protein
MGQSHASIRSSLPQRIELDLPGGPPSLLVIDEATALHVGPGVLGPGAAQAETRCRRRGAARSPAKFVHDSLRGTRSGDLRAPLGDRRAGRVEQHAIVESHYRNMLAYVAVETGTADPLAEALADADRQPVAAPPIVSARAMKFQLALGRTEAAIRRFEQLMVAYARLPKSGVWLVTSAYLAEVAAELGSTEQMTTLLRALAPYHRLFVAPGAGVAVCFGSVARHLGMLAAGLGDWAEAERYLLEAVERNSHARALPCAARALHVAGTRRGQKGTGKTVIPPRRRAAIRGAAGRTCTRSRPAARHAALRRAAPPSLEQRVASTGR